MSGSKKVIIFISIAFIALLSALSSTSASAGIFTIGIIEMAVAPTETVAGFKAGMAESGYIEGVDVKYIYRSVVDTNEKITDNEIRGLLFQKIDLLLTVTNEPALRAKKAVKGTGIPVLAVACIKMAQIGLVNNLKHPEGNVTGVQVADSSSKGLEWLAMAIPTARKIYVQYNPQDGVSNIILPDLKKAASQLGLKLVPYEVHTAEEAVIAIKNLPKGIDAIFRMPAPTFFLNKSKLDQAIIDSGLPSVALGPTDDAVATFGSDRFEMGRQAARLAHLIHNGTKPSDLPVEIAEVFLTINLKMAEKIGLYIPDDILMQAKKIIR
jgi:putative tryptophan/tyrosine transport system substrate-binding protein